MANCLHAFRRDGIFYWRRRFPVGISRISGRSHLCVSLRTVEVGIARRRSLRLTLAFEEAMNKQKQQAAKGVAEPTKEEIDHVLRTLSGVILEECEDWAVSRPPYLEARQYGSEVEFQEDYEAIEEHHHNPANQAELWAFMLECTDFDEAASRLLPILEEAGITMDPESLAFKKLARRAMRIGIATMRNFVAREAADAMDEDLAALRREPAAQEAVVPLSTTVSGPDDRKASDDKKGSERKEPFTMAQAFAAYRGRKLIADWRSRSSAAAATSERLATAFFGDTLIEDVDRDRAMEYRDALLRMPKYQGKGRFKDLTMQAAIALADELQEAWDAGALLEKEMEWPGFSDEGVLRFTLGNVNKHMTYTIGAVEEAIAGGHAPGRNPFKGLLFTKRAIGKQAHEERQMWEDEQVRDLLKTPIWTGSKAESRRSEKGDLILRDARFWLPLISLYSGLRLEEACQLLVADVGPILGIDCFLIRPGKGKILKSPSAERQVPIHSMLKRLGFLGHVQTMRERGQERLFPELERGGKHKLFGYRFSKRFTDYRRAVGLYEPLRDFHSLRHSFATNAINRRADANAVSAVLGHTFPGETLGRYFKGFKPEVVVDAVERVDYGIDYKVFS